MTGTAQDAHRPDYIVIGAGSSGAVIADRLSAEARHTVALLEAGGGDFHPLIRAPAGIMHVMGNPKFDWGYKSAPDPTRDGRTEHWPRGRLLGGSSSTNGMIFVRGQREDYDDWSAAGATGWSFEDVLPYFRKMERTSLGQNGVRGRDGPVVVEESWRTPNATEAFIAACGELQISHNPDYNGLTQEGAGFVQANIRHGIRHSTATAYLKPARSRRNLRIIQRAVATRIIVEGQRAIGVEYRKNGRLQRLLCNREVILSAGAIGSPHLLMLSGIGPAADLAAAGVPVALDLSDVGKNLRDHANFLQHREVTIPTLNTQTGGFSMALHMARWMLTRSGPVASGGAHGLAFVRTQNHLMRPDVQFHFSALSYEVVDGAVSLAKRDGVTIIANVCRPKSTGIVRLTSSNPADAPAIEPRMFDDPEDLDVLVRGAQLAARLFDTEAFRTLIPASSRPELPQDDDAWRDLVRTSSGVTFHPAGTCRMGTDADAVVDPTLRVRGIAGLRVADASVFPTLVSGNTNAAAMMVGEKASDLIRAH